MRGGGWGVGGAWKSKPSNIDQSAASDGSVGGEVKAWPPLHQGVLPNQLKGLGCTLGLLKFFVMSPPSYSATSPTPLISDADMVIVYDSEGEEFKHWRRAGMMYWSQLSVVVVGSLGAPRRAKFCPVVPRLVVGDAEGVPPLQRIPQAEVMAEEFARALVQAWGPPTLEWCQNKAPCVFCAWQGEACVFDAPSVGLRRDTSVCLLCRANHEKCLILLEWRAVCVAVEQGWGKDWVWSQLGKVQRTRTLGEASLGRSAGQVGPPWGGWREGASSAADRGKRRASPPLGVGPSKRLQGCSLRMGIKFSGAPTFDHGGLPLQAGGGANGGVGGAEKEALERAWNTSVRGVPEQVSEVWGLWERPTQQEGWPTEEAEEREMAPEAGLLRVELEVARQREDWLANKAASGRAGILRWVWEHRVLLDGASTAFASIQDGLAQMPGGQPPELQQGMVRVGRLLAGHQWHNAVAPESWWEVVADAGEALLGLAEVLAVVWAQMEIDLGVGMVGVPGEE
ncbi:hypothetical protein E4T56_gene20316 [Termitomyces sp. T112]|nr:hypothetical protein E4T56_gene20316 [Termitomyces sp. T112]